ncbi:MAG: SpoIIE family protein phosphatase [Kiritimatiellae bacterium]|nr:SpoIIE family protein phosphatase [Kiritimatiellia bacterium]
MKKKRRRKSKPGPTQPLGDPLQQASTMRLEITPQDLKDLKFAKATPALAGGTPRSAAAEGTTLGGADFQELLHNIYDGALITDLQGRILDANERAMQLFHTDRAGLVGQAVLDLVSGASPALLSTIWETLESDRFVLIQAACVRRDGSAFPAEISVNRLRLAGQDGLNFFLRDITLRKAAEEQLRTGYNAIQNSGNGIAVADAAANFQYLNPAILRLFGCTSADDLRGANFGEFLGDTRRMAEIIAAVERRDTWRGELELRRRDGTAFFAQTSVAPNLSPEGELAGMVLSVLDTTSQRQAQRQLERYAREIGQKNRQMEDDLQMAREIHRAFLPRGYPGFPRDASPDDSALRFSHLYLPSGIVGGDFFDVLPISNTHAGVFICDVVGHGLRAALIVATLRGLITQLAPEAHDPARFLTRLNESYTSIFRQEMDELMFVTALYLVIDFTTGQARYSSAGHPPPYCLRPGKEAIEALDGGGEARGPGIGLFENPHYGCRTCQLAEGDIFLMYTDGLSEAAGPDHEYYETERMPAALRRMMDLPLDELLPGLVDDARAFTGRKDFEDDICLLAVKLARLGRHV